MDDPLLEIKVLNRESFFEQLFKTSVARMIDYETKFSVMQALSVNLLEILIALGVVGIVIGVNIQGKAIIELAPVLALFMVAAVRLGPSLARVGGAFQTLRYNRPAMKALYSRLKDESSSEQENGLEKISKPIDHWQQLTIKKLNFYYPLRENFSPKDISISLKMRIESWNLWR